jgi:type I restriction enzyme S subunit
MNPQGDIQLLQLKHIGNMVFQNKSFCHIDEDFFNEHGCSEIRENYLLISRLVATSMVCCLMPKTDTKTITSVDVCWIAQDETYNSKYLMYYLTSKGFQNRVLMLCSGSTRKRISKKNLIHIPIFIHDRAQQDIIVKQIENLFDLVEKVIG